MVVVVVVVVVHPGNHGYRMSKQNVGLLHCGVQLMHCKTSLKVLKGFVDY